MGNGVSRSALGQLETLFQLGVTRDLTDAQLMERFIRGSDVVAQTAFRALVDRHGPMVLGVCRRVLQDTHAADDAFQATFLILVRKATSVAHRDRLGNWLHGVALRTARVARSRAGHRRTRELRIVDDELPDPRGDECSIEARDLRAALDGELARLPRRYREALILCDLEGRSRTEAARQLGVPEGTLSSRLARGREILRARLTRRGWAPSATVALFAGLTKEAGAAFVPSLLKTSTVHAALGYAAGSISAGVIAAPVFSLTQGVLKAMFLTKMKVLGITVAGSLAVATIGTGVSAQYSSDYPGGDFGANAAASEPQASAERFSQIEQKLDKVLQMLESPRAADSVWADVEFYQVPRRATDTFSPSPQPARAPFSRAEEAPPQSPLATYPGGPEGHSRDAKLFELERRVDALKEQVEGLAKRLAEVEARPVALPPGGFN